MITIKQVIESDFEFTNNVKREADVLFMKPSMIHQLIAESKMIQGSTRYLNINKKQVSFVNCPIIEIAENYQNDYLFLDENIVEAALEFYRNDRFDTFRCQLWDSVEGEVSTEPSTGNEESPIFDIEISEHLVDCYKRWKDNAMILAYQESLRT